MKKYKTLITVVIILLVAAIIFVSFFGINVKNDQGEKRNLIPDYKMGMEFTNAKEIIATVNDGISTETIKDKDGNIVEPEEGVEYTEENGYTTEITKINPDEVRTVENYKKTRDVIQEKLKNMGTAEYNVTLNEETGEIRIKVPDNDDYEKVTDFVQRPGSLVLLDLTSFEFVFDNSYVKTSRVVTRQGDLEAGVFLEIEPTEEGVAKLQELGQKYTEANKTTQTITNEDGTTSEQEIDYTLYIMLNGMPLGATYIDNITYDNKIMIPFAVSSNNEELNQAIREAQVESVILNAGTLPISYEFNDDSVENSIYVETALWFIGIMGAIFVVLFVYLIIRFRAKGFISMYFQIGFFALMLLIIRYTDVTLTTEGIAGMFTAILVNYIFNHIMLRNVKQKTPGMYKNTNLKFLFYTLPIFIIAIVFTFESKVTLASFGMTLFWGMIITYIYNFVFSKFVFENLTGGKNESVKENS